MNKVSIFRAVSKFVLLTLLSVITLFCVSIAVVHLATSPMNEREWSEDQKVLSTAVINNDLVTISHIRNFSYTSTTDYTANYYDKTFDMNMIKGVWYIVEPFQGVPGSAHTFLSFEFDNDNFISISIEIRKEKGESFHPLKGVFNRYELIYVVADEKDVIALRTNHRKDLVYLYKTTANKEKAKDLFLNMIGRVNALAERPEFYNTITNNCTTNIVRHINTISPKRIPAFSLESIFPEYSDALAYKLGLLDTALSFDETRKQGLINEKAMMYANDEDLSVKIRQR